MVHTVSVDTNGPFTGKAVVLQHLTPQSFFYYFTCVRPKFCKKLEQEEFEEYRSKLLAAGKSGHFQLMARFILNPFVYHYTKKIHVMKTRRIWN